MLSLRFLILFLSRSAFVFGSFLACSLLILGCRLCAVSCNYWQLHMSLLQMLLLSTARPDANARLIKTSSEMAIRHNPKQRWCYYPAVTNDEIIVLKQFSWEKRGGQLQPYRCPLHVAFKDHSAPVTEQRRRNCEYRFQVSIGAATPLSSPKGSLEENPTFWERL